MMLNCAEIAKNVYRNGRLRPTSDIFNLARVAPSTDATTRVTLLTFSPSFIKSYSYMINIYFRLLWPSAKFVIHREGGKKCLQVLS